MQIEHKLQVGAMALLLSLIAIAGPATSQTTPDQCVEGALTGPLDTAACEAFLEENDPTEGQPCPPGTTGDGIPECQPDVGAPPCLPGEDDFFGCLLEATTLFSCEDLTDPSTCEPSVDAQGTVNELICGAIPDSAGEDAATCITDALSAAVCGAVPDSSGDDALACLNAVLADATACEEDAEGTFPDCDGTVAAALANLNALCDLDADDAAAKDESFPECDPAPTADAGADVDVAEDTADVALDGSASADGASGIGPAASAGEDVEFAWAQTAGTPVTLSDDDVASPTFDAPHLAGEQEVLVFELTVTDSAGQTDVDTVVVTVTNFDNAESSIGVTVDTAPATMDLAGPATAPDITPDGTTTTSANYFVTIDTQDGVEHISDSLLDVSVKDPNNVVKDEGFDSSADTKEFAAQPNGPNIRTYTYGLTLPGRLADGTYTVSASYDGSTPAELNFNVDNVAPTITGTPANHNGRESFGAQTTPLVLSLDDFNWGTYDGSPVAELESLSFSVSPATAGFTVETDLDADETFDAGTLDLSAETGNEAISVPVKVTYDGTVADGIYVVTATVTDDDGETASLAFMTISLVPFNFGFSMVVNDGGDGVSLGSVSPDGGVYSTEDDPLEIQVTGTLGASTLTLDIADFENNFNNEIISADGMTVDVYGDGAVPGVDDPAFTGTINGNTLTIDLAGENVGLSGESVFLVFSVNVYPGTDGGAYATAVDLLSTADE